MIARIRRTPLVIILSSLFALPAQAQDPTSVSTNFYKLVVENSRHQAEDLIRIFVAGKDYFLTKTDADAFKLAYSPNDMTTISGELVVKLNNLGLITDQGSDLILHANARNLESINYNFQNNVVQSPKVYLDSAFMNYNFTSDSYSKTTALAGSFYKTFSDGVLYNLAANLSNKKSALVDVYREQYFKDRMTTARVGSGFTGTNSVTNPVSFFGVQYRKDTSLDSNYLVAPYLSIAGTAEVKSVAEIYVNDRSMGSLDVSPGPYSFSNLTTGQTSSNQVRVVMNDINGLVQSQSVNLVGAPFNLRRDTDNFSFEAGRLRHGYDQLGSYFASGTYAYGLTDHVTLEGHLEATSGQARGAGSVTYATPYGTVKYGFAAGTGELMQKLQYSYQKGDFYGSVAASKSNRFAMFGSPAYLVQDQKIATAGYRFGSSSLSGNVVQYGDAPTRSSLNFNTNINRGTLSVRLTRAAGKSGIAFMFNTPIGKSAWRSITSAQHDATGTELRQSIIRGGNSYNDWSLQAQATKSSSGTGATATYQYAGEKAVTTAYIATGNGQTSMSGRMEGSLVFDKGIHASRQIFQGYTVVETGTPGLPVALNNMRVATTGKDGIAIVPNTSTTTDNLVSLPADLLPVEIQVDDSVAKVSSQKFFKSSVVFKVKKSPVVLQPEVATKGLKEVEIDGKKFAVIPQGIFFDDYQPGRAYELQIKTCKMKFSVKQDASLNEQIPLHCEKQKG
jgi:outer membrane usher protein FimD/PapC